MCSCAQCGPYRPRLRVIPNFYFVYWCAPCHSLSIALSSISRVCERAYFFHIFLYVTLLVFFKMMKQERIYEAKSFFRILWAFPSPNVLDEWNSFFFQSSSVALNQTKFKLVFIEMVQFYFIYFYLLSWRNDNCLLNLTSLFNVYTLVEYDDLMCSISPIIIVDEPGQEISHEINQP